MQTHSSDPRVLTAQAPSVSLTGAFCTTFCIGARYTITTWRLAQFLHDTASLFTLPHTCIDHQKPFTQLESHTLDILERLLIACMHPMYRRTTLVIIIQVQIWTMTIHGPKQHNLPSVLAKLHSFRRSRLPVIRSQGVCYE